MNRETARKHKTGIEKIIERLLASENVCDNRKGNDLNELLILSHKRWRDMFHILRVGSTPEGALAVVCRLQATGLIWSGGQAVRHDSFHCVVGITNSYPLSMPSVQFLEPVPWCGHVVHKDFLPEVSTLSAQWHEYLRQGHGRCCYLRSSQWSPATGTLAIVLWQVSRLVTLSKEWAESVSLNPAARDYALRLIREDGRLPLGESLPYPHDIVSEIAQSNFAAEGLLEGDDIDWSDENEEVARDAS